MMWKLPFKYAKAYPHWPVLKNSKALDAGYWDSQETYNMAWRAWYRGRN